MIALQQLCPAPPREQLQTEVPKIASVHDRFGPPQGGSNRTGLNELNRISDNLAHARSSQIRLCRAIPTPGRRIYGCLAGFCPKALYFLTDNDLGPLKLARLRPWLPFPDWPFLPFSLSPFPPL